MHPWPQGQYSTTRPRQTCADCGSDIKSPIAKLKPSIGTISPVMDLHGQKKHYGEADQLTLASGGSEMHSYLV